MTAGSPSRFSTVTVTNSTSFRALTWAMNPPPLAAIVANTGTGLSRTAEAAVTNSNCKRE